MIIRSIFVPNSYLSKAIEQLSEMTFINMILYYVTGLSYKPARHQGHFNDIST